MTKVQMVTQLPLNNMKSSLTRLTFLLSGTKCNSLSGFSIDHSLFYPFGPHMYQSIHFLTAHIRKKKW